MAEVKIKEIDSYLERLELKGKIENDINTCELFLKKIDPNIIQTLKYINVSKMINLFSILNDQTDVFENNAYFGFCAQVILESYEKDVFSSLSTTNFTVDQLLFDGEDMLPQVKFFLKVIKDNLPLLLEKLRKNYNLCTTSLKYAEDINKIKDKNIAPIELFNRGIELSFDDVIGDKSFFSNLYSLLKSNECVINDIKQEVSEIPVLSLEDKKINEYKKKYDLDISDVSSFEDIISLAKGLGIDFFKKYLSTILENKKLFLENYSILKRKNIADSLILSDLEVLFLPDLEKRLNLIEQYFIPYEDLFKLFDKPITDLSYFRILDLLIENDCLDIKNIASFSTSKMNALIFYRLQGIKKMNLNVMPFTEEEINTYLASKSTMLSNLEEYNNSSLYDDFMINGYTLEFDGIKISRPKVLRNLSLGIDALFVNEFYRMDEIESIKSFLCKEKH